MLVTLNEKLCQKAGGFDHNQGRESRIGPKIPGEFIYGMTRQIMSDDERVAGYELWSFL